MPKFSIITPSFRQLDWLKLCAASIADQVGVTFEHIVQDAGTGPELEAWAATRKGLALHVEKDKGMYDAVNRGFRKASGEILAYLNCDEQYLPGTLEKVGAYFDAHPDVDVVFGDVVVVDPNGDYICSRQVMRPGLYHTWACTLAVFAAGTFLRRRLIDELGLFFNDDWKVVGDSVWILEMLKSGVKVKALGEYTSVFADTGENLCLADNSRVEQRRLFFSAPRWVQKCASLWAAQYRLRRALKGHYWPRPFSYAIYTHDQAESRREFPVPKAHPIWRTRLHLHAKALEEKDGSGK